MGASWLTSAVRRGFLSFLGAREEVARDTTVVVKERRWRRLKNHTLKNHGRERAAEGSAAPGAARRRPWTSNNDGS